MAKRQSVHHRVFGVLTRSVGDLWKRSLDLHIFGRNWTVELLVDVDQNGDVEPHQIAAYQMFCEDTQGVVSACEDAIFDYYQSICREVRGRLEITCLDDDRVPIINSVREVFRMIEPTGVTFPYAYSRPTFGILCECSWEEEHGLGVKFEDGKLVEVGFQDIVL